MLELIRIISAQATADGHTTTMTLEVETLRGTEEWPFSYDPEDEVGLGPAVKQYLTDHPETVIAPYVALN